MIVHTVRFRATQGLINFVVDVSMSAHVQYRTFSATATFTSPLRVARKTFFFSLSLTKEYIRLRLGPWAICIVLPQVAGYRDCTYWDVPLWQSRIVRALCSTDPGSCVHTAHLQVLGKAVCMYSLAS
jgi:hypothetical protein